MCNSSPDFTGFDLPDLMNDEQDAASASEGELESDDESANSSDWSLLESIISHTNHYRYAYFRESLSDLDRLRSVCKQH